MKFIEISNGFQVPIFGEEKELYERVCKNPICEDELSEREGFIAHEMAKKGLLLRVKHGDEFYYDTNLLDVWRI